MEGKDKPEKWGCVVIVAIYYHDILRQHLGINTLQPQIRSSRGAVNHPTHVLLQHNGPVTYPGP